MMAKQQIKRFAKFPELKNLDSELDKIIKQIQDNIGILDPALGEVFVDQEPAVDIVAALADTFYPLVGMKSGENNKTEVRSSGFRIQTEGLYKAIVSCSFTCDVNNTLVHGAVFVNDVLLKKTQMHGKIATAGDIGAMLLSGYGNGRWKESTVINMKFTADKACTITVNHLNFLIEQSL